MFNLSPYISANEMAGIKNLLVFLKECDSIDLDNTCITRRQNGTQLGMICMIDGRYFFQAANGEE